MTDASPWLKLKEGAVRARRSPRYLAKEIAAGRLRAARVGERGLYALRAEWIDEWIEAQSTPVPVPLRRRA